MPGPVTGGPPPRRSWIGWVIGGLAVVVVLLVVGIGALLVRGGSDPVPGPDPLAPPIAVPDDPDGTVDAADDPPTFTAQELGERFGDAVWRVDVDGCGLSASGSAFAIAPDLFVTNAHVVEIDPNPTLVSRHGDTRAGTVIGLRDWPDIAVIQVDRAVSTTLEWAPTDELVEGQPVTALSYPTPLLRFSVAPGTLMSFQVEGGERIALASDEITDFGSSGGPLLDARGRVAGVVTEFAAGDGRQLVGLSYTYAFLRSHIEAIIADPTVVAVDCDAVGAPTLPEGWDDEPWGTAGADAYGSDPGLDRLWDGCEAGDMQACDDLYRYSPLGSAYEAFGDSCGARNEPAGWCVDIYPGGAAPGVDGLPDGYGSDPELDGLWDGCEAGDMQACDDLYRYSPLGSAYEAFGDSCGGRNEPAGWCVDIHG